MTAFHWLLPIVGIGFVIFVHELGHFMAARWCGIRVEAFSIGFGPRLFGFRRGSTDWKICLIPLGGFVKMAGETPGAERTGASDEFSSKTVAQRSFVISAGVIMNVIFALVSIPIAFMIGVPFEAPVLGAVDVGAPAWKAGLRANDRVLAVDGRRTLGFEDVVTAIAIGGDVVTLSVERDGRRFDVPVPTERDPRRGLPTIGIAAALAPVEITPADVDPALASDEYKDAAAHRRDAGLVVGDRILTVDGVPISELQASRDLVDATAHLLRVLRDGREIEITLPALVSTDQKDAPDLFGFMPSDVTVKAVLPGSPAAALGLLPKDRVVRIGGSAVHRSSDLVRVLSQPFSDSYVQVERGAAAGDEGLKWLSAKLSDPEVRRSLRSDVEYAASGRRVVPIEGGSAAAAGIRPGDEIVAVDGTPVGSYEDILKIDPGVRTATFSIRRDGAESGPVAVTVTRARRPENRALSGLEQQFLREVVKTGFGDSLVAGFDYTVMMTARVFMTLKSLFSRRVSAEHLGGIITIFRQSHESSKIAFSRALLFLAVISINLAVLNVLPIPVLDGGWLLLLLIEKLRGRPVSERVLGVVSWIGFGLVLGLMLFATWNDIKRL
jgi:regulator of sigma E protease